MRTHNHVIKTQAEDEVTIVVVCAGRPNITFTVRLSDDGRHYATVQACDGGCGTVADPLPAPDGKCAHCEQPNERLLCPPCFLAGHRGVRCDAYCRTGYDHLSPVTS